MKAVLVRGGPTIFPAASTSYGTEAANEGKTRPARSERSWQRAAPSFLAGETQAGFITTLGVRKNSQRKRGVSQVRCAARQRIAPFVPPVNGRPGGKETGEQGGRGKQGPGEQEEDEEESMESLNARLPPNHRSGYVAVVGKPNAGKSTLMNQLVGQKVSIVSQKPQTTRHQILGILSEEEYQVILFDTPGVISERRNKLEEMMMRNVRSAMINSNAVLAIVDATLEPIRILETVKDSVEKGDASKGAAGGGEGREPVVNEEGKQDEDDDEEAALQALKRPLLVVLNKKDLVRPRDLADKVTWYEQNSGADDVIAVSAKYGPGVGAVREWVLSHMPLGPAYYPKDIVSEHPERFFVAEILREKIFLQYKQEVPYSCQVNCVDYKARKVGKDMIYLEIVVEKDNQKGILIGKGGEALKKLAMAARKDIEEFLQKEVFLDLRVSVRAAWREDERLLETYGFEDIRA